MPSMGTAHRLTGWSDTIKKNFERVRRDGDHIGCTFHSFMRFCIRVEIRLTSATSRSMTGHDPDPEVSHFVVVRKVSLLDGKKPETKRVTS